MLASYHAEPASAGSYRDAEHSYQASASVVVGTGGDSPDAWKEDPAVAETAGLAVALAAEPAAAAVAAMSAGQVPKEVVVPEVAVKGGMVERDAAVMDSD